MKRSFLALGLALALLTPAAAQQPDPQSLSGIILLCGRAFGA